MTHLFRYFGLSVALTFTCPAVAAAIDAQAVNTASIAAVRTEAPAEKPTEPDPAIVHLQVLLDRAGASPGVIDGYFGDNLQKAIAGFEALQGLSVDGQLDPEVLARLVDDTPVIQAYAITQDDAKDTVQSIPEDYAEQAEMDHLGYTSVAEKLAERFHMHIALIKALNTTAAFNPGETIAVATPGAARTGMVKRIEVRRRSMQVFAIAEDESLLAVYPATIGSEDFSLADRHPQGQGCVENADLYVQPQSQFPAGQ